MHHLIFPTKDSHITNQNSYADKNLGLDEILKVGSYSQYSSVRVYTHLYTYPDNQYFDCLLVDSFAGTITGSFTGTASYASGSINGTGILTASYFVGSVTGSVFGFEAGVPVADNAFSGSLSAFSGNISSSAGGLFGYLTASFNSAYLVTYTGYISGSTGQITGYLSGSNTANEQGYEILENKVISRALLKFDLTAISRSIADGSIPNPQFRLKMKIAKEEELPLAYTLYTFPVSQSWEMGTGYFSDGGSNEGVSWNWRNFYSSSYWYPPVESDFLPTADYLNDSASAWLSFNRGGGTWYYKDGLNNNVKCTQSFDYETSDVYMNVTSIVRAWITGSLPNEGFIVMSSLENQSGSNGLLTFFSRDTNTIFSPTLDVMWDDSVWTTGSVTTASVTLATFPAGISSSIQTGSTLTIAGGIAGLFSGSGFFVYGNQLDVTASAFGGFVVGQGLSGNITGMPVLGNITGSISVSQSIVTGPCGNDFTASFVSASFTSGLFSGSSFGAYYVENKLENGWLTGSWSPLALLGAKVEIPIPTGIEPYAYAYVHGIYVNGTALGIYTLSGSSTDSASFSGQFIDGQLAGGTINLQMSGSVFPASYMYTSSVEYSTNALTALNTDIPFVAVVQNLRQKYSNGNVVRINVFGREEQPLKNFVRRTQLTQYMIPAYLPTASYYAVKDNETEEVIIDFDAYTRLSCDEHGNFFILDMTGLAQERNYRILLKSVVGDEVYVFDNGDVFKIVR